jgi:hypothetical protein
MFHPASASARLWPSGSLAAATTAAAQPAQVESSGNAISTPSNAYAYITLQQLIANRNQQVQLPHQWPLYSPSYYAPPPAELIKEVVTALPDVSERTMSLESTFNPQSYQLEQSLTIVPLQSHPAQYIWQQRWKEISTQHIPRSD